MLVTSFTGLPLHIQECNYSNNYFHYSLDWFLGDVLHVWSITFDHIPLSKTWYQDHTVYRWHIFDNRCHHNVSSRIPWLHVLNVWSTHWHRCSSHLLSSFHHNPRPLWQICVHSNKHRSLVPHPRSHFLLVCSSHTSSGAWLAKNFVDPCRHWTAD